MNRIQIWFIVIACLLGLGIPFLFIGLQVPTDMNAAVLSEAAEYVILDEEDYDFWTIIPGRTGLVVRKNRMSTRVLLLIFLIALVFAKKNNAKDNSMIDKDFENQVHKRKGPKFIKLMACGLLATWRFSVDTKGIEDVLGSPALGVIHSYCLGNCYDKITIKQAEKFFKAKNKKKPSAKLLKLVDVSPEMHKALAKGKDIEVSSRNLILLLTYGKILASEIGEMDNQQKIVIPSGDSGLGKHDRYL